MTVLHTQAMTIGYRPSRRPAVVVAAALDLTLHAGEMVCLLGPNGAGKSTLLRTIAGLQPPLAGEIIIGGDDLTTLKPPELARRLSIVLTERPNAGLMSGYQLVALGRHPYTGWSGRLRDEDQRIIQWAVDAVAATPFAGRPFDELSDGQKQKIMIARALAQEPDMILLDEPTAFLDLPRRVQTMSLLRQLARQTQRGILLSTHDLDLALRTADLLWLMSAEGRVYTGTPEDLILNGMFERVFAGEGVTFDPHTGRFQLDRAVVCKVRLEGEGLGYFWTRRALERENYVVAPAADHTITVYESDDGFEWSLDGQARFQSIRALVHALTAAR